LISFWKKCVTILKSGIFWTTLGAIALSLLLWFLLPLIPVLGSTAVRLGFILGIVLIWGIINLIILLSRPPVKDIPSEGSEKKVASPEEIKEALDTLKKQFQDVRTMMKGDAQSLPWYLVVGNPGSGRTSLLKHSGLPYPMMGTSYRQIQQSEGEFCQWWFSKEAVFIDTSTNLLFQNEEETLQKKVWDMMLSLLKSTRRNKPLNGIILTIDIATITAPTDELSINILRLKLQELMAYLGIQCPIYVVMTKMDKVAGFREFFSHHPDKNAALGISLPLSGKDSVGYIAKKYDDFLVSLEQFFLKALGQENDKTHNALSMQYLQTMEQLKSPLQKYLSALFESSAYQSPIALRGVFFTSSFQESQHLPLLESFFANYGIETAAVHSQKGIQSFFIQGLFLDVIFKEKYLFLFNARQLFLWRFKQWLIYLGCGVTFCTMLILWGNSFLQNKNAVKLINHNISEFTQVRTDEDADTQSLLFVLPLLKELSDIQSVYEPQTDPLSMRFGLYQGEKIDDVFHRVYQNNLQIYFMPYLVQTIEGVLKSPQTKPNELYYALRAYLMLGAPDKLEPGFFADWMNTYWTKEYKGDAVKINLLNDNLSDLLTTEFQPIQLNQRLISTSRDMLSRTSQAERDYFELQELAQISEASDLRLSSGVDNSFNRVFGKTAAALTIPALYTEAGYQAIYKEKLSDILAEENYASWVLGVSDQKVIEGGNSQTVALKVRELYMRDYIRYWKELLSNLQVQPFTGLKASEDVLSILSGADSPFENVLALAADNTSLSEAEKQNAGGKSLSGASLKKHAAANQALVRAVQPKALQGALTKVKQFTPKYKKSAQKATLESLENPVERTPVDVAFGDLHQLMAAQGVAAAPAGAEESKTAPATPSASGQVSLKSVMDNLNDLHLLFEKINRASSPNEAAYQFVLAHLDPATAASDPLTQLNTEINAVPAPLKEWLQTVSTSLWQSLLSGAMDYINTVYQSKVATPYQDLFNQYPFSPGTKREISAEEFGLLFNKNGVLDKFYQDYLSRFIDSSLSAWKLKIIESQSLPLSNKAIYFFQKIYLIQQTYFTKPGEAFEAPYHVNVISLSSNLQSADLLLQENEYLYQHGPKRPQDFVWTLSSNNTYQLDLTDLNGFSKEFKTSGNFGLLRLLDLGSVKIVNKNVIVSFYLGNKEVVYQLSTDNGLSPFIPSLLKNFSLIPTLKDNL
jgi:type VI secretion system protein ImpL